MSFFRNSFLPWYLLPDQFDFNFLRDLSDEDDDEIFQDIPQARSKRKASSPLQPPAAKRVSILRQHLSQALHSTQQGRAAATSRLMELSQPRASGLEQAARSARGAQALPVAGPSRALNNYNQESQQGGSISNPVAGPSRLSNDQDNQHGAGAGICSVCLVNPVDSLLRCGHCFCASCLSTLKAMKKPCPKCRARFRKWSSIYLG